MGKSVKKRIQNKVGSVVNNIIDEIRDSAISGFVLRESSDLYRRDDRQKRKFEQRAERDEAAFNAQTAENEYLRNANAAARLSRTMYAGLSEIIGGSMRLSSSIGEANFMNRYLGGGV
jgi:hypothetical protein